MQWPHINWLHHQPLCFYGTRPFFAPIFDNLGPNFKDLLHYLVQIGPKKFYRKGVTGFAVEWRNSGEKFKITFRKSELVQSYFPGLDNHKNYCDYLFELLFNLT